MIDIHCHILPGIDDGSGSLDESVEMARMAARTGVTGIVTTPHFRGTAASLELMPELLWKLNQLKKACRAERIPLELYPGAEIFCTAETVRLAEQGLLPTLADSSYVLAEFRFEEAWDFMDETLDALKRSGYRPVVAHPERYVAVQAEPHSIRRWFEKGYVIQMNKGSVLGSFGSQVRRTAREMLRDGTVHVIATDAHWADRRTTDVEAVSRWCRENLGGTYSRILLEENPRRIIRNQELVPVE